MELKFVDQTFEKILKPPKLSGGNTHYTTISKRYEYNIKDATIRTFDNLDIDLVILRKRAAGLKKRPFLIYNHSHGSEKNEALQLIETCDKLGLDMAIYDSRGCGKSSDAYVTFGHNEKIDLLYVLFYVLINEDPIEFILWGRSIGCCAVLQLINMITSDVKKSFRIELVNKIAKRKPISDKFKKSDILDTQFKNFLEKNPNIKFSNEYASFTVIGIVLDSPIKSIKDAITNFFKCKVLNLNFVATYISKYLNNYLEKKININLNENNNENAIKEIFINSYIMFSKKDEFVSEKDEECIKKNYGLKTDRKLNIKIQKLDITHKGRRSNEIINQALKSIIEFPNKTTYSFCIDAPLNEKQVLRPLVKTLSFAHKNTNKSDFSMLKQRKMHGSVLFNKLGCNNNDNNRKYDVEFLSEKKLKGMQRQDSPLNIEIKPNNFFMKIDLSKKTQVEIKTPETMPGDNIKNNTPSQMLINNRNNRGSSVDSFSNNFQAKQSHFGPQGEQPSVNVYRNYRYLKRDSSPIAQIRNERSISRQPIQVFHDSQSFVDTNQKPLTRSIRGGYSVDKVPVNNRLENRCLTDITTKNINSNEMGQETQNSVSVFDPHTRKIIHNNNIPNSESTSSIFRTHSVTKTIPKKNNIETPLPNFIPSTPNSKAFNPIALDQFKQKLYRFQTQYY